MTTGVQANYVANGSETWQIKVDSWLWRFTVLTQPHIVFQNMLDHFTDGHEEILFYKMEHILAEQTLPLSRHTVSE